MSANFDRVVTVFSAHAEDFDRFVAETKAAETAAGNKVTFVRFDNIPIPLVPETPSGIMHIAHVLVKDKRTSTAEEA